MGYLADMRAGWSLNADGVGTGKTYASCYQDPSLACPTMSSQKYRATLIQDQNPWLVMELCEPLDGMIDLSAEFRSCEGERFVLTIIIEAERPPQVMGFRLLDDNEMPLAAGVLGRDPHAEKLQLQRPLRQMMRFKVLTLRLMNKVMKVNRFHMGIWFWHQNMAITWMSMVLTYSKILHWQL